MITRFSKKPQLAILATAGLAALALCAGLGLAQNVVAPANLEQTAPVLPADAAVPAVADTRTPATPVEQTSGKSDSTPEVKDYTEQIGSGLKERERRLTLLNEAMMKLREAGEMEDAARVEDRIRSLLAMPAPSQVNGQLKAELERVRAKNDELLVQMASMDEELKRLRGTGGSGSIATRRR